MIFVNEATKIQKLRFLYLFIRLKLLYITNILLCINSMKKYHVLCLGIIFVKRKIPLKTRQEKNR